MMTPGFWIVGALVCLLGAVVLAVLAFAALHYSVGERPGPQATTESGVATLPRATVDNVGR